MYPTRQSAPQKNASLRPKVPQRTSGESSDSASDPEAVPERNHHPVKVRRSCQDVIELTNSEDARIFTVLLKELSERERVVHEEQSPRAKNPPRLFQIEEVALLIRVQKDRIY